MYARVSTIKGGRQEEVVRFFLDKKTNPPGLEEMKGGYLLADDQNEPVMVITFWQTKEALDSTLPVAKKIIGEAAKIAGVSPDIEIFEVLQEL